MARNTRLRRKAKNVRRKRNTRAVNRVEKARSNWVITATKRNGGARLYYAGGARLTTETKDAIKLPSMIHADNIKKAILADFPVKLTKNYLWQAWPLV